MIVSLIWAMSDDGVIGIDNRLPWRLPADMRWFRQHTLGKPVVMGRKTFESLGAKPLPGRDNIVVTRDRSYQAEGVKVVTSPQEALEAAGQAEEVMVIGGAELYRQMLSRADRLYLTLVHGVFEGDTRFPELDLSAWQVVEKRDFSADEENPWSYSFLVLERKSDSGGMRST